MSGRGRGRGGGRGATTRSTEKPKSSPRGTKRPDTKSPARGGSAGTSLNRSRGTVRTPRSSSSSRGSPSTPSSLRGKGKALSKGNASPVRPEQKVTPTVKRTSSEPAPRVASKRIGSPVRTETKAETASKVIPRRAISVLEKKFEEKRPQSAPPAPPGEKTIRKKPLPRITDVSNPPEIVDGENMKNNSALRDMYTANGVAPSDKDAKNVKGVKVVKKGTDLQNKKNEEEGGGLDGEISLKFGTPLKKIVIDEISSHVDISRNVAAETISSIVKSIDMTENEENGHGKDAQKAEMQSAPHSPLKPLPLSPLRSAPQSSSKGKVSLEISPLRETDKLAAFQTDENIISGNDFAAKMTKNLFSKICEESVTKGETVIVEENASTAKEFRGEVLAKMLRENFAKAVHKGEEVSAVTSDADMKKSLFTIIKNAMTMSKVRTEAAGYVLEEETQSNVSSNADGSSEQSELNSDVENILRKIINEEHKNGAAENGAREDLKENEEKSNLPKSKSDTNSVSSDTEVVIDGDTGSVDPSKKGKINENLIQDLVVILNKKRIREQGKRGKKIKTKARSDNEMFLDVLMAQEDKKVGSPPPQTRMLSECVTQEELALIEAQTNNKAPMAMDLGLDDVTFEIDSGSIPTVPLPQPAQGVGFNASAVTLDQLEKGMIPVDSIRIEQIEADGTTTKIESMDLDDVPIEFEGVNVVMASAEVTPVKALAQVSPIKPKTIIDKTKLFSQMNDTFAKDTHNALKDKPVYQKRSKPADYTPKPRGSVSPRGPAKSKEKIIPTKPSSPSKGELRVGDSLEHSRGSPLKAEAPKSTSPPSKEAPNLDKTLSKEAPISTSTLFKEAPKPASPSKDEASELVSPSKEEAPKTPNPSKEEAPKPSSPSKEDDSKNINPSKEEEPKAAGFSEEETPKPGREEAQKYTSPLKQRTLKSADVVQKPVQHVLIMKVDEKEKRLSVEKVVETGPTVGGMVLKVAETVPKIGETALNVGETVPKIGEMALNVGETVPKMGDTALIGLIPSNHDSGARQIVKIDTVGETVPKVGDTALNVGENVPKVGDTVSQVGEMMPEVEEMGSKVKEMGLPLGEPIVNQLLMLPRDETVVSDGDGDVEKNDELIKEIYAAYEGTTVINSDTVTIDEEKKENSEEENDDEVNELIEQTRKIMEGEDDPTGEPDTITMYATDPVSSRQSENVETITIPIEVPDIASEEATKEATSIPKLTQNKNSELTKSLRKVRLNKKSPVKTPIKEKWEQKASLSPSKSLLMRSQYNTSLIMDLSSTDSIPSMMTTQSTQDQPGSSQKVPMTPSRAGTEVFDFTDDEDIPLTSLDLEAIDASKKSPLAIVIPDHHLQIPVEKKPVTPRPSPGRMAMKKIEVSPTVLSKMDAMAAVAAVQAVLISPRTGSLVKLNGDVMSDDTENGHVVNVIKQTPGSAKGRRRKRKLPESDGGDTEDDFDHQNKELKQKRNKNVSGASATSAVSNVSQSSVTESNPPWHASRQLSAVASRSPSVEGARKVERPPSAEGVRRSERPPSAEGGRRSERPPSVEGGRRSERPPSAEGGRRSERPPSAEGGRRIERPPSAASMEGGRRVDRPPSAASVTSLTSNSGKKDVDSEKMSTMEDMDGKLTPDSQKSSEEKASVKAISTVVPEKASSFAIHPDRTCADCCFYCQLKFGMLDTPLHVAQLKTMDKQSFAMEFTGFDRDACLCDRCFRFLDRKAQHKDYSDGKGSVKASENAKEEKVKRCVVRTCNKSVTSIVSKKWLIRLKKKLVKKVSLDWDKVSKASVKATFPVCDKHNMLIEFYSNCGLCKRKLTVGGICTLGMTKQEVEDMNLLLREDHIPADLKENNYVCKLCKTFCGIKQKSLQPDYLKNHKTHKAFYKDYRRRLYIYLELEEEEATPANKTEKPPKKMFKVSQSDGTSCKITIRAHTPDLGPNEKRTAKHKEKDFASPSAESKIYVDTGETNIDLSDDLDSVPCQVKIQFDLNTKKLWQDLHYPYGNYTSFFRHLILLEKYWRSGDLTLSNTASIKGSVYLKSVQNRIKAYEGKQKQSDADLSANTRPDLDIPSAPAMIHIPGEPVLANLNTDSPSPKASGPLKSPSHSSKSGESTILRIPNFPGPRSPGLLSPHSDCGDRQTASPLPPKIRVRQDLMATLGLVANDSANIVQQNRNLQQDRSSQIERNQSPARVSSVDRQIPSTPRPPTTVNLTSQASSTPNLAKLLNESSVSPSNIMEITPKEVSTLIAPQKKSSNSQLFKNTESSGAIPLTFNNSIAEVLAAASKAKNQHAREPSPKPEVTITPKHSVKQFGSSPNLSHMLDITSVPASKWGKLDVSQKMTTVNTTFNSPSPSGGGLSILRRTPSSGSNANPLTNMSKLLQIQSPGLPPHIIAQQALPARSTPKVMSRPPGPVTSNLRPVQISSGKPSGIQTVNKKSLTTVLDRLSGLGTNPTPPSSSSSLVQQLQAPPMSSRPLVIQKPGPKSIKEAAIRAQFQGNMASQSPPKSRTPDLQNKKGPMVNRSSLPGNVFVPTTQQHQSHGNPGMPIGQPMVQFPSQQMDLNTLLGGQSAANSLLSQSLTFGPPNPQAAQAALLMAGMSGLTQSQAQAAMQELLKSTQFQQSMSQQFNPQQGRIRAPPPLKNMTGRGSNVPAKHE